MESSSTVEKAVDLLFYLHSAPAPVGVTAIGRALGIPKSSAHRVLQSLAGRGLVERDARGHYRPGFGLLVLGLGVQDREPVVAAARPLLEAEARDFGETLFLVVARGGELIVLDKVEGTGFLRAAPQVGSSVPIHATAVGKLYLAFGAAALASHPDYPGQLGLPDKLSDELSDDLPDELPDLPSRPRPKTGTAKAGAGDSLETFTPETLVERDGLARAIRLVREQGWASNRDEWIPGLSVIAAPVLAAGRMQAAVALAAPSARLEELGGDALGERLKTIARATAARIEGYGAGGVEA